MFTRQRVLRLAGALALAIFCFFVLGLGHDHGPCLEHADDDTDCVCLCHVPAVVPLHAPSVPVPVSGIRYVTATLPVLALEPRHDIFRPPAA